MSIFVTKYMARWARAVAIVSVAVLAMMPGVVIADDWVAERLRGRVFVLTDGAWEPLERGDVVSDNSPIQSTMSGRATFERDNESITIGGDTIIQIVDLASSGPSNTVVHQQSGMVTIEADVREVQHFRVETPFLAAVVKGTQFSVRVRDGGAEVNVNRGRVQVQDATTDARVEISPGQSAGNIGGKPLTLSARGGQEIIVPGAEVQTAETGSDGGNGPGNNGVGLALGLGGGNGGGNGNGNSGNGNGNSGGGVSLNVSVGGGNSGGGNGNNGNGNGNSGGGVAVNVSVGGGNGNSGGLGVNVGVGGLNIGL